MAQPVTPQDHIIASARRQIEQRQAAQAVRDELKAQRESDQAAAQAAASTVEQ